MADYPCPTCHGSGMLTEPINPAHPDWCMRNCGCSKECGHKGKCALDSALPQPGCKCLACIAGGA